MSMEDALVRERPLYDRGKPIDAVLEDLRASGFGMIDCIKAARELRACSLAEAKKIARTPTSSISTRMMSERLPAPPAVVHQGRRPR